MTTKRGFSQGGALPIAMCAVAMMSVVPQAASAADTLRVVAGGGLNSAGPAHSLGNLATGFLGNSFETLTTVNRDGVLEGVLATSWEPVDGGRAWRFKLKQGVVFSDGTPFNADAVVKYINYLLTTTKTMPGRATLGTITGAVAIDDLTVEIRASAVFTGMPIWLSNGVGSIVSPKSIEQWGIQHDVNPSAGTGPYKLETVSLPDHIVLVRNPLYRGEPAKTERLDVQFIGNEQTRLAAVLSGDADIDFYPSSTDIDRIKSSGTAHLVVEPSNRAYVVHLPMAVPEMQDHRVREALNYVVDRQALIANLFKGTAIPLDSSIGPNQLGYRPVAQLPYDPERAAKLFAEAGWVKNANGVLEKDGKPFPTIRYQASNGRYPSDVAMAQAITGYLTAAGVPTQLNIDEFAVFYSDARAKAAKEGWMTQMAWASAVEGAATLCAIYNPSDILDFGGYKNPVLVDGCKAMSTETDLNARTKIIEDTAEAVFKDFAAIFLISPSHIMAVRDGVEGVEFSRVEYNRFSKAVVK